MLFRIGGEDIEVDEIHTASCGARVAIIYPDDRSPETQARLKANIMAICGEIVKDLAAKEAVENHKQL